MKISAEQSVLPPFKPYTDPVLKNDRKAYLTFISDLRRRGLLTFRERCKSEVGVLFVAKKDDTLRMVVDARGSNRLFEDPPGVSLSTVESLSHIEVSAAGPLYISKVDVKNCFYRLAIDPDLAEFFGLPAFSIQEMQECGFGYRPDLADAASMAEL